MTEKKIGLIEKIPGMNSVPRLVTQDVPDPDKDVFIVGLTRVQAHVLYDILYRHMYGSCEKPVRRSMFRLREELEKALGSVGPSGYVKPIGRGIEITG